MKPQTLFNCCTNHEEPAWSRFTRLELGGCVTQRIENYINDILYEDEVTEGGIAYDRCQFFTVYGRNADDEAEAITDISRDDLFLVLRVCAHLQALSGLQFTFFQAEG